jgi:hypothetical protein
MLLPRGAFWWWHRCDNRGEFSCFNSDFQFLHFFSRGENCCRAAPNVLSATILSSGPDVPITEPLTFEGFAF